MLCVMNTQLNFRNPPSHLDKARDENITQRSACLAQYFNIVIGEANSKVMIRNHIQGLVATARSVNKRLEDRPLGNKDP